MQLRCTYCQTMFAISREDMLAALEHMEENKQIYYEAHCPKCRRGNRVERARMERFFPDWKTAIKIMAKESAQVEPASGISSTAKEALKAEAPKATKVVKKHTPKAAMKPARPAVKKASPKVKPVAKPALKPAPKKAPPKGKPASKPAAKPAVGKKKK
jgi:hypothetical protein